MKQIHLHFFLWQLELAGENGWLHTVTTWLQCHLLVTNTRRDAAAQVGGGWNSKKIQSSSVLNIPRHDRPT